MILFNGTPGTTIRFIMIRSTIHHGTPHIGHIPGAGAIAGTARIQAGAGVIHLTIVTGTGLITEDITEEAIRITDGMEAVADTMLIQRITDMVKEMKVIQMYITAVIAEDVLQHQQPVLLQWFLKAAVQVQESQPLLSRAEEPQHPEL